MLTSESLFRSRSPTASSVSSCNLKLHPAPLTFLLLRHGFTEVVLKEQRLLVFERLLYSRVHLQPAFLATTDGRCLFLRCRLSLSSFCCRTCAPLLRRSSLALRSDSRFSFFVTLSSGTCREVRCRSFQCTLRSLWSKPKAALSSASRRLKDPSAS